MAELKKGPRTNAQKARAVNVQNFGSKMEKTSTTGEYLKWNKVLPKSHTAFPRVITAVNKWIEANELGDVEGGISTFHTMTFKKAYAIAMRDPIENVYQVKCPKCKKMHAITCDNPDCGITHEIEMPSAQMERNSTEMLKKLMDKFAPNLAAITQDVNINVTITKITQQIVYIISHYVPAENKDKAMAEFNKAIGEAIEYVEQTES